jgi:hypothetical protein
MDRGRMTRAVANDAWWRMTRAVAEALATGGVGGGGG